MLDAASLKAIALEARHCFLYEDAPDFINLFYGSIKQLKSELAQPTGADIDSLYKDLVRSAHSIKGGAGLAELTVLNQLAHKMEDLLEAMAEGRVQDQETGLELVTLAMEEVQSCVDLASSSDDNPGVSAGAAELTTALGEFIESSVAAEPAPDMATSGSTPSKFIATSLNVDLEACVKRVEDLLANKPPAQRLKSHLKTLAEECQLLGEALSLQWLQDIAAVINQMVAKPTTPLKEFTELAIAEIREVTQSYLQDVNNTDLSATFKQFQEVPKVAAPPEPQAAPAPVPAATTASKPTEAPQKKTSSLQVRMPITQLNRMGNAVGELFIGYEQLSRHQQQLLQASRNLKQRTQQLNPIRDEVVTLYDQLAIASPKIATPNGNGNGSGAVATDILGEEVSTDSEFDSLHFDKYTQAHSNLQQFQELMVQVQEIREDIELIRWEFQNSLDSMRQQLEYLNQDLTQSRLVPFGKLARRFIQSLETLSQRYPQSAQLKILGDDVLVDQAILEQLRTPLTHLIRNAFDHGIEPPAQRRQGEKPDVGTITLSAKLLGNIVEIEVSDDGKGVNVDRVWEKAVAVGLHGETERDRLSENQILDFIFAPGFSTRQKVSDLSGRGMGLDIVRLELDQLNGTVGVDSRLGQGTKFTIRIPLSFNILPLLLCRCQQQVLALPSVNIMGVVALVDKNANVEPPTQLDWQGSSLKLHPLDELLPYPQNNVFLPADQRPKPTIAVVVRKGDQPLAITVDEIIGERELVLKALDRTVTYPPYIAGCTVLGTGEVVPVLIPDAFDSLLNAPKLEKQTAPTTTVARNTPRQPSILIIDDSVAVRRTLNKMLTQSGYQVHQCRDGKEAWNFLNRSNQVFDLAICDLEMPGYDGFTLLQMVRGQKQWDDLPFVMLTSRDNDLHRQKAERLGASNYFTKPFNPIQFLQAIAEYVD